MSEAKEILHSLVTAISQSSQILIKYNAKVGFSSFGLALANDI
jgi:hypothetical protein